MIGFVSALSASVAVVILVMSILAANTMMMAMQGYESGLDEEIKAKEGQGSSNMKNEEGLKVDMVKNGDSTSLYLPLSPSVITDNVIDIIRSSDELSKISVSCSYGNNFSRVISERYISYNTILLTSEFREIDVKVNELDFEPERLNRCAVHYE